MLRRLSPLDRIFLIAGIGLVILLTTYYRVPFRLDDVLYIDWAKEHSIWDAFHIINGEILHTYRPILASVMWLLTQYAGTDGYFYWHITLVLSYMIAVGFTGCTAAYIAQRRSALYITTALYWITFLPILNVLFWFSDLTFSLEVMFSASAWYFGIRGLFEGNVRYCITAVILSLFAIFSKEPAIVLTLGCFSLFAIFNFSHLRGMWRSKPSRDKIYLLTSLLLLIAASIFAYIVTPTRGTRFIHFDRISTELAEFFLTDRYNYYSNNLLTPTARMILVFPLCYMVLSSVIDYVQAIRSRIVIIFLLAVSAGISYFLIHSLLEFIALMIGALILRASLRNDRPSLMLLPFALIAIIILTALMVTMMLVKTQLTELSFVLMLIGGVTLSEVLDDLRTRLRYDDLSSSAKRSLLSVCIAGALAGLLWLYPTIKKRESMLRETCATRFNANDAIQWMARNLPKNSTVLVSSHSLYGIAHADDLTSQDDEIKVYRQYTFNTGFIRYYLKQLDRTDIRLGYLEDSTILHTVLNAFREKPASYLFLQTGYDYDRFHTGIDNEIPLHPTDTLVATFRRGSYPSEVWLLRQ